MKKITDPIFRFTTHLRQRYYERVLNENWYGYSRVDSDIRKIFFESTEDLSWQNNQYLVGYLKEKYGTSKFKFFKNKEKNLLFVCRRDDNISHLFYIVTCFFC